MQSSPSLVSAQHDFAAAYTTYYGLVYHRIRSLVGREEANDLTQETFTRAWKAWSQMHGKPLNTSAWLCRIATNLSLDILRRRALKTWLSLEGQNIDVATEASDPQMVYTGPGEDIAAALAAIPEGYRRAIVLQARGFTLAEIAPLVGIAPTGIDMYLTRARQALRKQYLALCQQAGEESAQNKP